MSGQVDWDSTSAPEEDTKTDWRAEVDPKQYCNRFRRRLDTYRSWLEGTGRAERIQRMWNCVWGFSPDGGGDTSRIQNSGGQGELLEVTLNEVGTLVEQTSAMILNQRPSGKAIARNSDFSSLAQARFADGLLEYNESSKAWGEYDSQQLTMALVCSEAWQVDSWDRTLGSMDGADPEGTPLYEGDISTIICSPFDICYDPLTQDSAKLQWFGFRYRANRFDYAKRFPECEDYLLNYNPEQDASGGWAKEDNWELTRWGRRGFQDKSNSLIWVWEVRCLPTPSLPTGRLVRLIAPGHILSDSLTVTQKDANGQPVLGPDGTPTKTQTGHYPYVSGESARLHAYQVCGKVVPGTMGGYSHHFDLLGLQEAMDNGATAMVSAANQGGIQDMYVGPQSNYQAEALGGLRVWEGATKPEPIDGVKVDPQVVQMLGFIREAMIRRVGLNTLAIGEQQHQMPAQLAALLQAQAVQYVNSLQSSLAKAYSESRTGRIYLYKEFAKDTRVAMIGGVGNSWTMQEWTGDKLSQIERVIVEEQPAYMRTTAGRIQLVDLLAQHDVKLQKQEILNLVETGRAEPIFEGEEANLLRIQHEKELLLQGIGLPPIKMGPTGPVLMPNGMPMFADPPVQPGQQPPTFIRPALTDTPWLDIPEYASVIANPVTRDNPQVVKAVTDLISYKIQLWHQMPPILMQLLQCPPELIAMMAPPPVPPPGAAPGEAPPPPGVAHPPEPGGPSHVPGKPGTPGGGVLPQGSPNVKLPAPPRNPVNGAQPPPVTTGTATP